MATNFEARIPGSPRYVPVAVRLLAELGALPGGPGEDAMEPLLPALETLVGRLLTALGGDGRDLELRSSLASGAFVLVVRIAAGAALTIQDDAAIKKLEGPFDSVEVDARPDGSLELTLSSVPSS